MSRIHIAVLATFLVVLLTLTSKTVDGRRGASKFSRRGMSGDEELKAQQEYEDGGPLGEEGDEDEQITISKVAYDQPFLPKNPVPVKMATEETLYPLRKKYDVLLLLILQDYHCKECAQVHRDFINVTKTIAEYQSLPQEDFPLIHGVAKGIGFAILDAAEEHEEFAYNMIGGDHMNDHMEDQPTGFDWAVPSVLIFKWEYQKENKKAPIPFLVNEKVRTDLPSLAMRLSGPDLRVVTSIKEFKLFLTLPSNDGVCFVVWDPEMMKTLAFKRLLEKQRAHTSFAVFKPDPKKSSDSLDEAVGLFNPQEAPLTAYHRPSEDGGDDEGDQEAEIVVDKSGNDSPRKVGSDGGLREVGVGMTPFGLNTNKDDPDFKSYKFEDLFPSLKQFTDEMLMLRPGHEYDETMKVVAKTVNQGECENDPTAKRTEKGIFANFHIHGTNLKTGVKFLKLNHVTLEVGEYRGDLPEVLVKNHFTNMCPGMIKKVVVPPGQGYQEGNEPPKLSPGDRMEFEVEMLQWDAAEQELADVANGKNDGKEMTYEEVEREKHQEAEKEEAEIRRIRAARRAANKISKKTGKKKVEPKIKPQPDDL